MNIVNATESAGVNGFEVGQAVIVRDDPFGKYVVEKITRASRIVVKNTTTGEVRSLTATVCGHPVKVEYKNKKKAVEA